MRDAHQSLLATRMRTTDMLKVAEGYAKNHPEIFYLLFQLQENLRISLMQFMKQKRKV